MPSSRSGPAPIAAPLDSAGSTLSLIACADGRSRAELSEAMALSRATLGQRLAALLGAGLVREAAATVPSGGRPTRLITLNPAAAIILAIDLGESHARLAVTDLGPRILAQETLPFRVADGPEATLKLVSDRLERLVAEHGGGRMIAGVGISLHAPVDHRIGRVFGPSVLIGWDDFPIGDWLARRFGAPAIAENDVNLLTVYEHRRLDRPSESLMFLKVGTGIGAGIMTDGRLYRGAQGASGDIGHIQIVDDPAPLCRCGKLGCLEARSAGWALARELRRLGYEAQDARDVVALVEAQRPEAIQLLRSAGRALGAAISDAIAILNPGRIIIGGTLARVHEHLLFGVRETISRRCLPLATRDLTIEISQTVPEARLIGAAHCVIERAFAPGAADALLARYGRWLERTETASA